MQQHAFHLPTVTEVTCSHVNIREENHGEEKVLAVDLSFWMEGSNDILELLRPGLRRDVYCNRAADAGQVEIAEELAVLPNLRIPEAAERQRFGGEDKHGGYRLICDYGLGDALSNVDLTDCVVGKKWMEPKEGGTTRIGWRVSYAGEALQDVMTRGKLTGLKGQKAFVVLNPPPVLQLVKASKGKAKGAPPAGADSTTDLLGDGKGDGQGGDGGEQDTPEKALERAARGG